MKAAQHSLATLFIRNKHLLVLSLLLALVAGLSALQSLPRLEDPVISNRSPLVLTPFPGASADRVEAQVTEPIEQELKEIPEIKHLNTTSQAGISLVSIELVDAVNEETNDAIFSEIRDRIADAARFFPEGAGQPFLDDKRNAVAYTLVVSLSWEDGSASRLGVLSRLSEELADRIRAVNGTELVRLFGEPTEEILVTVDPEEMTGLGLSMAQVRAALQTADSKVPAGIVRGSTKDLLVEVDGALDSVRRVAEVPVVRSDDGAAVRVGDFATVSRAIREPPSAAAYRNGDRTILIAARVLPDRQVDLWAEDARAAVEAFSKDAGGNLNIELQFNQEEYTSERLGNLTQNLLLGACVVFLVILVMMGWRSALIVGSALPLTAGLTLFITALSGGKLHQMSIFGMIIALGILIDNAIVMTDEVRKSLAAGRSPAESVADAVSHLFVPLFSSTLTTILAFLPILLLPGNAGDFVSSISASVVIALSSSLLVSMVFISSLAGLFGKSGKLDSRFPRFLRDGVQSERFSKAARASVDFALNRPLAGMAIAMAIPIAGFGLAGSLGSQFFPRTDRDMFELEFWMPTGTSLEETTRVAKKMEALLRERPEIRHVDWLIGGSFPSVYYNLIVNKDGSSHYAHAIITADTAKSVREMIDGLQAELDRRLPEAQTVVSKFAQGPPSQADVEIRILGPSIDRLQDLGEEVQRILAEHPGILQTQQTIPRGEPKLWFDAAETEAGRSGLQLTGLAAELSGRLEGFQSGVVLEEIEQMPVRVRYAGSERDSVQDARNLTFSNPSDPTSWIPLTAIGELELRPELGAITRRDGSRVNRIYGYAKGGTLPIEITNDVLARMEQENLGLPPGYRIEVGGESENQSEALGNLALYLPLLVVATVATLILTFRSVRLAALLLVVAGLSTGYGLFATWAYGFPLSFNTIIGCLGLIGLAFNSSIIVLAAIRADESSKAGHPRAMVTAIMGTVRHLVSTTFTTIGSFLPLLIFIGGEFWPPLAIVLAGGVGGSTLLALLFTPAAYRILYAKRTKRVALQPA